MPLVAPMDNLWWEQDKSGTFMLVLPWQLSKPSTLVSFWTDLGRWQRFVLVHLLPLKPVLISVYRDWEVQLPVPALWGATGPGALSFNIYMKPPGEIIHHHRMSYHQKADDIQLYSSILGEVSDAKGILSCCMEALGAWMGNNKLQLNLDKMGWLWVIPLYPGVYNLWS